MVKYILWGPEGEVKVFEDDSEYQQFIENAVGEWIVFQRKDDVQRFT
jgi:hypothetical protein